MRFGGVEFGGIRFGRSVIWDECNLGGMRIGFVN